MKFMSKIENKFSEDVLKWMKRLNRKGPFYLVSTRDHEYTVVDRSAPIETAYGKAFRTKVVNGRQYTIIWKDGDKVKLGSVKDGMYCRYGINTWATLTGKTISGLWQRCAGALTDAEIQLMLDFANDKLTLPEFKLETLEGLMW